MKKVRSLQFSLIAFFLMLGASYTALGQYITSYGFSHSTTTYTPISGTSLASGTGLDNQRYNVSLPFNFIMNGTTYTNVYVAVNGFLSFGNVNPGSGYWIIQSGASGFPVVSGFDYNLASLNATTDISYSISGTAPNRVFTAQWTNMGVQATTVLDASFQIRLFETSNSIDVVYGAISLATGSNISVQLGLRGSTNAEFNCRSSNSSAWNSTSNATSNTGNIHYTGGFNPPNGKQYIFSAPPVCSTPGAASNLNFTLGTTSISGSFSASSPAANAYLIVVTPNVPHVGAPVDGTTFATNASIGNGTVIYNGSATTFNHTSLPPNTTYTYTIYPYRNTACMQGPKYNTFAPASGSITSPGPKKYTWIPTSGTNSFSTATNWSPNRNSANSGDTLVFDNGGTFIVSGIPSQTNGILEITSNTDVSFLSAGTANFYLQDSLYIGAGSALNLGGSAVNLNFGTGITKSATINGTLTLNNNSKFIATNANTACNGSIVVSGTGAEIVNTNSAAPANLVFDNGGSYVHNRDGGSIPTAVFTTNSTIAFTGISASMPAITTGSSYGNFTWNCPGQTALINLSNNIDSIKGMLSILNTNSFQLRNGTGTGLLTIVGGITQTNSIYFVRNVDIFGDVQLNSGTTFISGNVRFMGNITQQIGHSLTSTASSSSNSLFTFAGNTHQNTTIGGTVSGPFYYVLDNPQGVTVNGIISVAANKGVSIVNGQFDGSGFFSYSPGTCGLSYYSSGTIGASSVEWPANADLADIDIDITSGSPTDIIWLPGDRTFTGRMEISYGILALGPHNLTIEGGGYIVTYISTTLQSLRFIAADSTGSLIFGVPVTSGGYAQNVAIGDLDNIGENSRIFFSVQNNTVKRYVSFNVKNKKHPNETSTTNYLNRYWTISDDHPTIPFDFGLSFNSPTTDRVGSGQLQLNHWNGSVWQEEKSITSFPYLGQEIHFDKSSTASAISGDYTGRETMHANYVWNGSVDSDYTVAANWTPARIIPFPTDILTFNNGQIDTVVNVPNDTITGLQIINNTTLHLQPKVASSISLSLYSDFNPATNDFFVENGSALYLDGAQSDFTIKTISTQSAATDMLIDGRIEIINNLQNNPSQNINSLNMGEVTGTVSSTGLIACGGTLNGGVFQAAVDMLGTYEHKYTTTNGAVPVMNFMPNSTYKIIGFTTYNYSVDVPEKLFNLVYDCPNQSATVNLADYSNYNVVEGTFSVLSTGTGKLTITDAQNSIKNYLQTAGVVELKPGTATHRWNLYGSLNQSGGSFSSTATGAGVSHINFADSVAVQTINFLGAAPLGQLQYKVSNSHGINLTVSNPTTSEFNINTGGGIIIASSAANPITSSLPIKYNTVNTFLAYENSADITATAAVFPAADGPQNLSVDMDSMAILMLPFSRTLGISLSMKKGNISIGANNLTLGTSGTSAGTLNYTDGRIIVSSGKFIRWYPVNGLPTSAGVGVGFYPVGTSSSNRNTSIYFTSSGAVTTAGTISVGHTDALNFITGLNIADAGSTLTSRTNAGWDIQTGNGLVLFPASLNLSLNVENMFGAININALHIAKTSSVVGTHANATGNMPNAKAHRLGLSLADVNTGDFYIATDSPLNPMFISVTNGNWNTGSTWNTGTVPTASDEVTIAPNTTVTHNVTSGIKSVRVQSLGNLVLSGSASMRVDSFVENEGVLTVSNDSLNLGNYGGGKVAFNNSGTFVLNNGTTYINGFMNNKDGSTFTQNAGRLILDANANNVTAMSVTTDTILNFRSKFCNLNAGEIIFVDPPVLPSTTTLSFVFIDSNDATPNHTTIFGDGQSTDLSGNEFKLYAYNAFNVDKIKLGNVLNRGSVLSTPNKLIIPPGDVYITGDLSMPDSNAITEIRGYLLSLEGNLLVAANNTLVTLDYIRFDGSALQTISGAGTFANSLTTPTANFRNIIISNSGAGVQFQIGDVDYSGQLVLNNGRVDMMGNTIFANSTNNINSQVSVSTTKRSWIYGKFARALAISANYTANLNFPIGTQSALTPVVIVAPISISNSNASITVELTETDHPSVSSSPVLPNKSINKYVTVSSKNIGYKTTPATVQIPWENQEMDAGVNTSNLIGAKYYNNTWLNLGSSASPNVINIYPAGNLLLGDYQIGEPNVAPLIVSQPVSKTVCDGDNTFFNVTTSSPAQYQWQQLVSALWTNVSNNAVFNGATTDSLSMTSAPLGLNNADFRCRLIVLADTQFSSVGNLLVSPVLTPTISIISSVDTICAGTNVMFTATTFHGGSAPIYQWKKNGVNVGSNSSSYSSNSLTSNDTITCLLTSNEMCATSATAISNSKIIVVNPIVAPTVSITANPANGICIGGSATFTATVVNGGTNPTYQWQKNFVNVGTNNNTYTDNSLNNNNSIRCIITSNQNCLSTNTATSNLIVMSVTNPVTPNINITVAPSSTICAGATATFTSQTTLAGSNPTYQWLKNGIPVGSSTSTYSDNSLVNGDEIKCVLFSSLGCLTTPSDTSTGIVMTVNPLVSPIANIQVTPDDSICLGSSASFSATIQNQGSSISQYWQKNNITVSTQANYSTTGLANGDVIRLIIVTNPQCAVSNTDTSNAISMNVFNTVTPTISVVASNDTICTSDTVTFTAAATMGGTNPVYQWKKNNVNVGTNSNVYVDGTLVNSDVVSCELTSSEFCKTSPSVTSSPITITVNPYVLPLVSINATPGNSVCVNANVTFTAVPTNGGANPIFIWKRNGLLVGTNSSAYSDNNFITGDQILCVMYSSMSCVMPDSAQSTPIAMTVNPTTAHSVSIAASPGTVVNNGQTVTFTATPINSGSAPTYQWLLNGNNVGSNTDTYISSALVNGDKISCNVTSSDPCALPNIALSNELVMVISVGTKEYSSLYADLQLYPNPTTGKIILKGKNKIGTTQVVTYELISMTGAKISNGMFRAEANEIYHEFNIPENTASGIYILKLVMKDEAVLIRLQLRRE